MLAESITGDPLHRISNNLDALLRLGEGAKPTRIELVFHFDPLVIFATKLRLAKVDAPQ